MITPPEKLEQGASIYTEWNDDKKAPHQRSRCLHVVNSRLRGLQIKESSTVKQTGNASQEIELTITFRTQNQHRGLCRRGLLQKIRPLALTNAAIATLRPAHITEKNKCRRSYLTAKE